MTQGNSDASACHGPVRFVPDVPCVQAPGTGGDIGQPLGLVVPALPQLPPRLEADLPHNVVTFAPVG